MVKLITPVRGDQLLEMPGGVVVFHTYSNELSPPSQVHVRGYWQAFKDRSAPLSIQVYEELLILSHNPFLGRAKNKEGEKKLENR